MPARTPSSPSTERGRRGHACAIVLLAVAAGSLAASGSARLPAPAVARVNAQMHNLKSSAGAPFTLFEYEVPTAQAVPHIVAIDKSDRVWFTESGGRFARNFIDAPPQNKIGRLEQNGTMAEWTLGAEGTSPMGLAFDGGGVLWIAERLGNRITRVAPDGALTHYAVPTANAWPTALALDSRGAVWFTETEGNKVAVLDPQTGAVREFPLPIASAKPTGLAVGLDGRVWIAGRDANAILRFDPVGAAFDVFKLPTSDAKPCGVTVDGKGRLWFSERNGGKIGTIGEDGGIREYPVGDQFAGPFILAADRRGHIWFSQLFSARIGRFDPVTARFEHFQVPDAKAYIAGIALDTKGNVWYAAQGTNRIGVVVRTDLGYLTGDAPAAAAAPRPAMPTDFSMTEFDVPTSNALPGIVAVDSESRVWFTQMGGGWIGPGFPPGTPGSKIGYVENGVVHELALPTPESGPTSIGMDPCGCDLWFTLRAANKIARVRDKKIVEYDIPIPDSHPVGIAVDRDHVVWVALSNANKIGRRDPSGAWRFMDLPDPDAQPRTVYVDQRNDVWFAEKTGNHVGRIDKRNWVATRWKIPTAVAWPLSLVSDAAGDIWFAEMRSDKLAVLERETGRITEYALPVQSAPFKLVHDRARDAMWVSTVFYNAILRFDLTERRVTEIYKVPAEGAWVGGLDADAHGCLWFTEQFANKVGRLCIGDAKGAPFGPAAARQH